MIKEPQGLDQPRSIVYDEVSIWVQCNNVPIAFLNKSILEKMGSQIGVEKEVDEGDTGSYLGLFARIIFRINITKSLKNLFE